MASTISEAGQVEVNFETDIRPMFREMDRDEMLYMFDLWSRDDVVEHLESIQRTLIDGSMPCDEPWTKAQLQIFQAWIDGGMKP